MLRSISGTKQSQLEILLPISFLQLINFIEQLEGELTRENLKILEKVNTLLKILNFQCGLFTV